MPSLDDHLCTEPGVCDVGPVCRVCTLARWHVLGLGVHDDSDTMRTFVAEAVRHWVRFATSPHNVMLGRDLHEQAGVVDRGRRPSCLRPLDRAGFTVINEPPEVYAVRPQAAPRRRFLGLF